jgi:uncharacterized membrane protein SpoIIM required for sporulation
VCGCVRGRGGDGSTYKLLGEFIFGSFCSNLFYQVPKSDLYFSNMVNSKQFIHNIDLNKISKFIYNILVATVTYSMV